MNETTITVRDRSLRVVRGAGENSDLWFIDYDALRERLDLTHEPMPKELFEVLTISLGPDGPVGKEIRAVADVLREGIGQDRSCEREVAKAIDAWKAPE